MCAALFLRGSIARMTSLSLRTKYSVLQLSPIDVARWYVRRHGRRKPLENTSPNFEDPRPGDEWGNRRAGTPAARQLEYLLRRACHIEVIRVFLGWKG